MGSETDSFVYINAALGKQIRVFDGGCQGEGRVSSGDGAMPEFYFLNTREFGK